MEEQAVIHSTFVIERSYPKAPERVFKAFADAAQKRRWFAEGENHEIEQFEMDFPQVCNQGDDFQANNPKSRIPPQSPGLASLRAYPGFESCGATQP